jgi:hypothetical protein
MNIHEGLHRLILRRRWINWFFRLPKVNGVHTMTKRIFNLSNRLERWRPIVQAVVLPKISVDDSMASG